MHSSNEELVMFDMDLMGRQYKINVPVADVNRWKCASYLLTEKVSAAQQMMPAASSERIFAMIALNLAYDSISFNDEISDKISALNTLMAQEVMEQAS